MNSAKFSYSHDSIYIWDRVVRLCHWGIVTAFTVNYFIAEPGRLVHEIMGYAAMGLLTLRIAWGIRRRNSKSENSDTDFHASFSTISLSKHTFKTHISHLKRKQLPANHGHNPFGWLMFMVVIALLFGLGITGFMMEEIDALFGNSLLEWTHSIMADVLYGCVIVHIAAVFIVQYVGNIQLVRPMLTGWRKR
ncbi:cytochrome B [Alteromonas sp. BL110]|uniref:cytochrome b/b6 domain-containing protein n=1 Tax=Alteromonas sp. BL110 TaxID=1714845 RepID=UPI000E4B6715|nr:cytochrome b/b6 domain-containing protein [Alteromonas sp. BL110]AXT38982.1 cytochrome B [Alteromonas sp. BL110]RKM84315.1 cytochrome B [Alteromonas sp. BL110]